MLKQQIYQLSSQFTQYKKQMTDLIENNVAQSELSVKRIAGVKSVDRLAENITFKNKGLMEIKGDIIMSGNIISENISNLSANVDVMLGQMLEAQRQLTEANTITITRQINKNDITLTTERMPDDRMKLVINFKRKPVGLDDSLTLAIEGLSQPLIVFFDFIHSSTHTSHPSYTSSIINDESGEKPIYGVEITIPQPGRRIVELIKFNIHVNYEFDQDRIMSHIVNYLDNNDKTFFENMVNNINEIKN